MSRSVIGSFLGRLVSAISILVVLLQYSTIGAVSPATLQFSSALQSMSSLNGSLNVPLPLPNGPIRKITTSSNNVLHIQCNGGQFGSNLDIRDCADAVAWMPGAQAYLPRRTFAMRDTHGLGPISPLPARVLGSKGRCGLNLNLIHGHVSAKADFCQINEASKELYQACATFGNGGIAWNIGGDNHLAVTLSKYEPTVLCGEPLESRRLSCEYLSADMNAGMEPLLFGDRAHDPEVQQQLPTLLNSPDARCFYQIRSTATRTNTESWYHIWESVVAVNSMCARHKLKGTAYRLGSHHNLIVELLDAPPPHAVTTE